VRARQGFNSPPRPVNIFTGTKLIKLQQLHAQRRFIKEAALELGCLRKVSGLVSQRRFAAAVGLTEPTISRLMRGHTILSENSEAMIRRAMAERRGK